MKGRESGMPEEGLWSAFYDADCAIERLGCVATGSETVVEFGSGYGTFTLPVARRTTGTVFAFDIEPDLVELLRRRAREEGLSGIQAMARDFVAEGTGLPEASVDHAMLYNILHIEQPHILLCEAWRLLRPGGTLSIIHWRRDPATPRGPSMAIRPGPGQCRRWAEEAGFIFLHAVDLADCCPYHYGLLLLRPAAGTV